MARGRAMEGSASCMKYLLGISNLVIFVGGLAVVGVGIWSLVDKQSFNKLIDANLYHTSAIILAATGGFIALMSFLGCCGAFKESKCLLYTYFFLLLVLFVLLIAGGIVAYRFKDDITVKVDEHLDDTVKNYGKDSEVTKAWDDIQQQFHCCGVNNSDSWKDWGGFQPGTVVVPKSCCKPGETCQAAPTADNSYVDGCLTKLDNFLLSISGILGGVAIGIGVLMLFGMIFSCGLARSIVE